MTIEIREESALIEGFKPGYYGCDCCHKDDCGCPDTGDTPDTGSSFISWIEIIVANRITDNGQASARYSPTTAETELVYSSSDESLATIDPHTGEITVIQDGVVTFCVKDLLSGLEDCEEVNVYKSVEPDTGTTGITAITIVVADTITDSGQASAVFSPATADTSLYYSSSDDSIAEIDPDTGEITVIQTGVVTFCVEDLYTGLEDCKVVNVIKTEPEPPETGITAIMIIVDNVITDFGVATSVFQPATAVTQLVYTSSDESVAVINPNTGEIEVIRNGSVTFCVEDLLTHLMDCKTVSVIKSEDPDTGDTGVTEVYITFVFNVLSTTEPAWIAENSYYPHYDKMIIDDGPVIDFNPRYTFSTTGIHRVRLRLIHPDNMDRANEIVWAGSTTTAYTQCYLIEYYVPSTVESMSLHMQNRNDMVEKVTLYPTTPPVLIPGPADPDYNYSFNSSSLFYVPAQSLNAYKTAPGWSKVADRFRAITG